MRTIITHFYNEEYMLPWWLQHHTRIFDHGILINYGSTDNSVAICHELAPHWTVVDSFNSHFDALMVDFEVMHYERQISGWKIALNVSEFFGITDMAQFEEGINTSDHQAWRLPGAFMVDVEPHNAPDPGISLMSQKHHGFLERDFDFATTPLKWYWKQMRSRIYHQASIGAYFVGRHQTQLPHVGEIIHGVYILWYGYAPWTESYIERKLSFQSRIPQADRKARWGSQHMIGREALQQRYQTLLAQTTDLRHLSIFK